MLSDCSLCLLNLADRLLLLEDLLRSQQLHGNGGSRELQLVQMLLQLLDDDNLLLLLRDGDLGVNLGDFGVDLRRLERSLLDFQAGLGML